MRPRRKGEASKVVTGVRDEAERVSELVCLPFAAGFAAVKQRWLDRL